MKIHPSKTGAVAEWIRARWLQVPSENHTDLTLTSGIPEGLGLLPRPAKVVWGFHPGAIHGFPYANWFSQYITGICPCRGASLTHVDACLSQLSIAARSQYVPWLITILLRARN